MIYPMQEKLRELLDKIYELEGLVHLSLKREDSKEDFIRLINRKCGEINDLSFILGEEKIIAEDKPIVVKEPEILSEPEEGKDKLVEVEGLITENSNSDGEEAEEETESNDQMPPEYEMDEEENRDVNSVINNYTFEENKYFPQEDENDFFSLTEYSIPDDDEYEIEEFEDVNDLRKEPERKDVKEVSEIERGKLVFSINDRYRFRRELFDNSDLGFNNSLALVASMDNYDEAEDYFLNELGMNSADSTVKDFLQIIRKYFR